MEDPNNCSPPPLTFVRTTTTIGSTMDALTLHASFFEIAYELLKLPSRRLQTLWEWKKPRLRPSHPQAHSACKAQVPATHRLRPSHPQALSHRSLCGPSTHLTAALSAGELMEALELGDPRLRLHHVVPLDGVGQGRAALEPSTGSKLVAISAAWSAVPRCSIAKARKSGNR